MRVTTTKSKSDESFYINYAFINEKGKSTSRIYKKLGKLLITKLIANTVFKLNCTHN
ncbi:hypothetical protein ACTQV6_12455 [Holdemanella porci]|uniref:hypothetical protein n=1 Tax=Holdemanella porci TaxID=2652276 RepID=UPI003F924517